MSPKRGDMTALHSERINFGNDGAPASPSGGRRRPCRLAAFSLGIGVTSHFSTMSPPRDKGIGIGSLIGARKRPTFLMERGRAGGRRNGAAPRPRAHGSPCLLYT